MRLHLTPRAVADVEAIADYLKVRSPSGARRVRAAILEALQSIVDFPRIGTRQSIEGVRKFGTRKYPYLIYYSIDDAEGLIIVLTVQHGARRPEFEDV